MFKCFIMVLQISNNSLLQEKLMTFWPNCHSQSLTIVCVCVCVCRSRPFSNKKLFFLPMQLTQLFSLLWLRRWASTPPTTGGGQSSRSTTCWETITMTGAATVLRLATGTSTPSTPTTGLRECSLSLCHAADPTYNSKYLLLFVRLEFFLLGA